MIPACLPGTDGVSRSSPSCWSWRGCGSSALLWCAESGPGQDRCGNPPSRRRTDAHRSSTQSAGSGHRCACGSTLTLSGTTPTVALEFNVWHCSRLHRFPRTARLSRSPCRSRRSSSPFVVMVPSANQATPHDKQSLHPSFLLLGTAFAPVQ